MVNTKSNISQQDNQGTLYVVATPIGNLEDISPRVIKTLSLVDLIACEDTRHTKKLCHYLKISTPLFSYYREKEQEKSDILVNLLNSGKKIALVSDAGTPAICDPGAILVNKARKAGNKILAIAGPSALTASLSIAGLLESKFFFGGFLPANATERKRFLKSLASFPFPLVFYETPHRIHATLVEMVNVFGDRQVQLFRELSKIHEECLEATITNILALIEEGIKGELVLIVEGATPPAIEKPEHLEELLIWYRDELRTSLKDAVHSISLDLNLPRSQVYRLALAMWKKSN